jgi:endonuclease YncB( thermonuclease family)
MMLLPKLVVGALSVLTVLVGPASLAQTLDASPGIYSPKAAVQSPPLRVEVIDGTRFRDIETHAVYRLYGIDTCASGQTARLGRQHWPCGTMAAERSPKDFWWWVPGRPRYE